jgi:hypothetical protein
VIRHHPDMPPTSVARPRFFYFFSWLFLAIALTGFSTTFFIPLAHGTLDLPPVILIHAVLVFGWLLLLIVQSSLVHHRMLAVHGRIGWSGAILAVSIVVSGILVGLYATRRDLANGPDDFVLGQFVNILIEMALFGGLVAAAVWFRRDSDSHKRFLLLATISALAPAWLRLRHLFPEVPNPFVVFSLLADSLLLIAIARDLAIIKRIHPVYVWAGGSMVLVHLVELAAITSEPWLRLSRWLLGN